MLGACANSDEARRVIINMRIARVSFNAAGLPRRPGPVRRVLLRRARASMRVPRSLGSVIGPSPWTPMLRAIAA